MTNKKNIVFAIGVVFIALFFAVIALVRQAEDMGFLGNLMYAPFIFCVVFFGTLWVQVIMRHLSQGEIVSKKWYVWFFFACITFWWLGIQLNHYLFFIGLVDYKDALSNADIFAHVDYFSWKTYISIGIVLVLGALGILIKMSAFGRKSRHQKWFVFIILFSLILAIGFVTNGIFYTSLKGV